MKATPKPQDVHRDPPTIDKPVVCVYAGLRRQDREGLLSAALLPGLWSGQKYSWEFVGDLPQAGRAHRGDVRMRLRPNGRRRTSSGGRW